MINRNSTMLIFFLLCSSYLSFGQCPGSPPLAFTFESTESRCESNGTITLHITGGSPFTDTNGNPIYNNEIISPIILPPGGGGQADSVFAALAADTYTVEVTDANGCTVTHLVTVPGTHMQLELIPTWDDATCDGLGGGWICGTPDEGRPWPPGYYMYELFDASTTPPTSLGAPGLDSCFTDLAQGSYQIRAYDSCNNFQTRDVILGKKTYASTIYFNEYVVPVLCDSTCLVIYVGNTPWGEFPYSWEVIASTESEIIGLTGMFDDDDDRDTLCFTNVSSGSLTLQMTDQCGYTGTYTNTWNLPSFNAGSGYSCVDGGFINAGAPYDEDDCPPDSTFTWELISGPPGFPLPPPQDSGYFPGLAEGSYTVKHTDCCGNMYTSNESVSLPSWRIEYHEPNMRCDSFVRVRARYSSHGPTPTMQSWVITSAPPGYPNPLPDTTAFYSTGFTLSVGPRGTYCWEATDICGRMVDTCFTYDLDTLEYTYDIDVIPGCVTANELVFNLTSNYNTWFRVNQISPVSAYLGIAGSGTTTFNNLTAGDYRIRYILSDGSQCDVFVDTITIPEYIPPSITGAWGIECDNGAGLITVQGAGGNTPYTYELFQGPVTRPLQSSPDFPGLPIGTYDIRMFDECLNSEITTVSIEPFMPVIQGYGGSFCLGDTAFLYVDYFELATYSWSGPNGATSDTSFIMIPNLTLADAGTYTINIDVKNPDQSACVAQTLTVDLEVFDCVCSPGDFTVNNIDCFGTNSGSVTATMISNSGGPFTYDWSTGGNTQTINNLPPGTYAVTITDAGGCVVTGDTTLFGAPKLHVSASVDNVSCASTSDGEVSVNATGGVPNYNYNWVNGQTTPTLTGLSSGTYTVSVTDANGCCSAFSLMVGTQDCSPCELAENSVLDICAEISANPNHELATLDCDGGGIDNQTECDNGGDPLDPDDDCQVAATANTDICVLIAGNTDHPLANQDCDDGGVSNIDECNNSGDPLDPTDDCGVAITGGLDICVIIGSEASHPLANLDCDEGGVDNYTECTNGGDPADPADDCETAIVAEIDICAIINGNPTHPWVILDCDNGGIANGIECANGGDPADPLDDLPCAPCDVAEYNGVDICELLGLDPNNPLATEDCDNGGIDNQTECDNGGNPNDPADECDMAIVSNTDICQLIFTNPTIALATLDCDNGGVSNEDECNTGEDPTDPEDDCTAAIDGDLNICQLINYDPNHPLANLDCDDGGVLNWTECQSGGDPSEPSDDCSVVIDEEIDICALLTNDPNNPLGPVDCDGDGVTNATECTDGTDPLDPCFFLDGSITLPVTADQSDCENLCPDLTPITTILPGNIAGASSVGVAIEITELNNIDTDGSGILVRVPSDPRLTFIWDPALTSVALTPVNNANWNYLGDNGVVHTFQYTGNGTVIAGGTTEAFGFESVYDPQNTDGQTTITASIVPFGGGECNILNDTDSERLVYFE